MNIQKINSLYTTYNRFSFAKLSLNYYTLADTILDREVSSLFVEDSMKLVEIVSEYVAADSLEHINRDEMLNSLLKLRKSNIKSVENLTLYIDKFNIYEYMLAQIYFKISNPKYLFENTDKAINEILEFVTTKENQSSIRNNIKTVIELLPVRFTKNKFYSLLKDGLSIYENGSKKALEGILYIIRSNATILNISSVERMEYYNKALENLESININEVSEEELKISQEELAEVTMSLLGDSEDRMLLQELINDMLILIITGEKALHIYDEEMQINDIFKKVNESINNKSIVSEDELIAMYAPLEGKQEAYYEKLGALEAYFESLDKDKIGEYYDDLSKCSKLTSNSPFMELEEEEDFELVTAKELEESVNILIGEFNNLFTKISKPVRRMIMSKILSVLPIFLNSLTEFEKYVIGCFEACENDYEKGACMEVLRELMVDAYDME
jgi:hypothetical protein